MVRNLIRATECSGSEMCLRFFDLEKMVVVFSLMKGKPELYHDIHKVQDKFGRQKLKMFGAMIHLGLMSV